jgi:hypothetical protein
MKTDQIINRLNNLRSYGLGIMDKTLPEFSALQKIERKVSLIVQAVDNGSSPAARLKTADRNLTKAGF